MPESDVEVIISCGRSPSEQPGMKRNYIFCGFGRWLTVWYKPEAERSPALMDAVNHAYKHFVAGR